MDEIVAYNPKAHTITVLDVQLPSPRRVLGCAENSQTHNIYCFGGDDAHGTIFENILEFDPSTESLIIVNHLPKVLTGLSCAEHSQTHDIYCFGGRWYEVIKYPFSPI